MTTVLCDGKYLIADHRATTRVSVDEVLKSVDLTKVKLQLNPAIVDD